MSLVVTEAVSVGRGCSLLVPRQADSKAESEDSRPRILNSNVASQVVMEVDLSWREDRASFSYQFVSLIYNSRAWRPMLCAAGAVGAPPVVLGFPPQVHSA